jgi:hypothetical protein
MRRVRIDRGVNLRYHPAMIPSRVLWIAGAAVFALLLGYATLISLPPAPPTGAEHSAPRATEECLRLVRDSVESASFPFSTNVAYEGDARYRLQGIVEGPIGAEVVRRNYECVVRYEGAGRYQADTVRVWQSH